MYKRPKSTTPANVISVGLLSEFGLIARVYYVLRSFATDSSGSISVSQGVIIEHFGSRQNFSRYVLGLKLVGLVRSTQRSGDVTKLWLASPRSFCEKNNIDLGTCFKLDPNQMNLKDLEYHAAKATVQDLQNRASRKINSDDREHSFTQDLIDIQRSRDIILEATGRDLLTDDNTTILKSIGWMPDTGNRALGYNPGMGTLIIVEGLKAPQISQKTIAETLKCSESKVQDLLSDVARIRLAFWDAGLQQFAAYKGAAKQMECATVRFKRDKGQDLFCRLGGNYYLIDEDYEIVRKYRLTRSSQKYNQNIKHRHD